jgi:hypothetical protein
MQKRRPQKNDAAGDPTNLWLAVSLLTAFAGVSALASAFIAGYVLDQLQSTEALALIVTDGGLRSDSADLERNLSWATLALKAVRDLGWALAVGCLGVGIAVLARFFRPKAATRLPGG